MPKTSTPHRLTREQIVPSEIQEKLIYYRDQRTEGTWFIGAVADRLYMRAVSRNAPATQKEVFAAVGYYAGLSGRRVEDFYRLHQFYPQEIRDRYPDLSISHFQYAMTFGSDKAIAMLNAAQKGDRYGSHLSVSALKRQFEPPHPPEPSDPPSPGEAVLGGNNGSSKIGESSRDLQNSSLLVQARNLTILLTRLAAKPLDQTRTDPREQTALNKMQAGLQLIQEGIKLMSEMLDDSNHS